MKVAVVIDTWFPFIGGGQINTWEISKRLSQKGILIDIVTRNNGQNNLRLPKNLKVFKLGDKRDSKDLISKIMFPIKAYFFLLKRQYDLVHAHAFLPGITAKLLMLTKNIPAVFTIHGTSINTDLNNLIYRFIERFILTKIQYSAQITVSQDFLKIKNVNEKVIYIPNGVDVDRFDKVEVEKLKNFTLIFVGRLHPQKNLPTLIKSIDLVRNDIPNVKLIIVGTGMQKQLLLDLVKNLRLKKNIKMVGEVKGRDLISLYKSCHIFILPSIYEGQPLALFEAWASKLPVITTKVGDCQYLVKKDINGYLINDTNSKAEIAKVVRKALENKNLEKLGNSGYNLVKQSFSWDKSAQKTLEAYRNAVKS